MGAWLVDVSALGLSFIGWMAYQVIFIWRARGALALNCRRSLTPEDLFSFGRLSSAAHTEYAETFQFDGLYGAAHTSTLDAAETSSTTTAPGGVRSRAQVAPAPSAEVATEVAAEDLPHHECWPEGILVTEASSSAVFVWRPRDAGGGGGHAWEAIHEERSFRELGPHADPYFAVRMEKKSGPASRQNTTRVKRSSVSRQQRSGLGSAALTPSSGSARVGRPRRMWGLMQPNPGVR